MLAAYGRAQRGKAMGLAQGGIGAGIVLSMQVVRDALNRYDRRTAARLGRSAPVRVPAVQHPRYAHDSGSVVEVQDHAPMTYPQSPPSSALELLEVTLCWIVRHSSDRGVDGRAVVGAQVSQVPTCLSRNLDIPRHQPT